MMICSTKKFIFFYPRPKVVWDVENDSNGIMLLIREKYSHEFKICTLVINTTNYKSWKINWFPSRK